MVIARSGKCPLWTSHRARPPPVFVRRWTVDDLDEAERELVLAVLAGNYADSTGGGEKPGQRW